MLIIRTISLSYAQWKLKFLMRIRSVHVSFPDAKAQRTHKGQSIKFTNIFNNFYST
jgi:hypothetical protein